VRGSVSCAPRTMADLALDETFAALRSSQRRDPPPLSSVCNIELTSPLSTPTLCCHHRNRSDGSRALAFPKSTIRSGSSPQTSLSPVVREISGQTGHRSARSSAGRSPLSAEDAAALVGPWPCPSRRPPATVSRADTLATWVVAEWTPTVTRPAAPAARPRRHPSPWP
jgi:hypothetical protein